MGPSQLKSNLFRIAKELHCKVPEVYEGNFVRFYDAFAKLRHWLIFLHDNEDKREEFSDHVFCLLLDLEMDCTVEDMQRKLIQNIQLIKRLRFRR